MSSDTSIYFNVRGSMEEKKEKLSGMPKEWLEAAILDGIYNKFLAENDSYADDERDKHGHGKRVPYIGWFWRHIEFSELNCIPIGDCGDFVGFMANNKWDYPERYLTEGEAKRVIGIIDEAIALSQKGGAVSEIWKATYNKLDELWDYMQTLEV